MYEEQRMLASGVPFSEVLGLCAEKRKEEAFQKPEKPHKCTCGGSGNCPGCPNRNK